jgi:hypothetical protein
MKNLKNFENYINEDFSDITSLLTGDYSMVLIPILAGLGLYATSKLGFLIKNNSRKKELMKLITEFEKIPKEETLYIKELVKGLSKNYTASHKEYYLSKIKNELTRLKEYFTEEGYQEMINLFDSKLSESINEDFEEYDHFDEISPEQAYQEVEQEMGLPKKEDIKDEIESAFEFIEGDGLNPYEMTFDEFYNWTLENFRLEYPKSFYENEFKSIVHNPNQLELPFEESMKHLITFNETSNKKIMDTIGGHLLKHKDYAEKNKVSINVDRIGKLTKDLVDRIFDKYNEPNFYKKNRCKVEDVHYEYDSEFSEEEIEEIKKVVHPLLLNGIDIKTLVDSEIILLVLYYNITLNNDKKDIANIVPADNLSSPYVGIKSRNRELLNIGILRQDESTFEVICNFYGHEDSRYAFLFYNIYELVQFLDDLLNKN